MREDVLRVVETYIEAVRKNDTARLPLHRDVVFAGPLRTYRGVAEFEKGIAEFIPLMKSIDVIRLTADEETCAAVLDIDTVFGRIPFLEYFHVQNGKIVSIRAYYDPRMILEGLSKRAQV